MYDLWGEDSSDVKTSEPEKVAVNVPDAGLSFHPDAKAHDELMKTRDAVLARRKRNRERRNKKLSYSGDVMKYDGNDSRVGSRIDDEESESCDEDDNNDKGSNEECNDNNDNISAKKRRKKRGKPALYEREATAFAASLPEELPEDGSLRKMRVRSTLLSSERYDSMVQRGLVVKKKKNSKRKK